MLNNIRHMCNNTSQKIGTKSLPYRLHWPIEKYNKFGKELGLLFDRHEFEQARQANKQLGLKKYCPKQDSSLTLKIPPGSYVMCYLIQKGIHEETYQKILNLGKPAPAPPENPSLPKPAETAKQETVTPTQLRRATTLFSLHLRRFFKVTCLQEHKTYVTLSTCSQQEDLQAQKVRFALQFRLPFDLQAQGQVILHGLKSSTYKATVGLVKEQKHSFEVSLSDLATQLTDQPPTCIRTIGEYLLQELQCMVGKQLLQQTTTAATNAHHTPKPKELVSVANTAAVATSPG